MEKDKMFKRMRPFYLTVLCAVVLSLAGCWSADEINNLATISVIGIDQNDTGQIEVTTIIAKPHTLFTDTNVEGNEQSKFVMETTTGQSIFEAISNLSSSVSEEIYFGHVDAIVFGERAARKGMESSLDFFKRNEFRPNAYLLVTQGSASELVKMMPPFNITQGLEIVDLVNSNRFATTGMVKDLSQFTKDLSSNTTDPYTGVISSAKQEGIDTGKNEKENQSDINENDTENTDGNQQNVPETLSLKDTAVFKSGQLKGFLEEKETRGLLWTKGELESEIIVLDCGKGNEGTASLKVTDSESQLSPQVSDGTPQMTINIQVEADIGQLTCPDINVGTNQLDRLNQQFESMIKRDVSHVLNKAKNQWQTDIFGFGQTIYQHYPQEWKQMAPQWRNGLLKNMEIDVIVSANISRYGLNKNPSEPNEAE